MPTLADDLHGEGGALAGMAERYWYIKRCRLFDQLTADQLARLEQRARFRRFAKNTPIYLPSEMADGVFLVGEGRVKICSITPEGKQAILAFVEPGELFGELALIDKSSRDECAETLSESMIVLLPADVLERLMADSPALSLGITKLIGFRRKRIERRLKSLLFRSHRERLVSLLVELTEQYGQSGADGIEIGVRLSQQDLAAIIGATRETVTVLLGELQLEGLLKVSRQRVIVRNLQRLARAANLEPPRALGESPSPPPTPTARRVPFGPHS